MRGQYPMIGLLVLGLAGCGSTTDPKASPSVAPSQSPAPPPKVAGKLLVQAGGRMQLLTQAADGHLSGAPFDVPKFDEYEVSADHKLFVYRSGDVVTSRSLTDGSERKLAGGAAGDQQCLRIAPDARHVSFRRDDDLVTVDLAGKVTVLDKVKHSSYSLGAVGNPIPAKSALSCGEWLDATHVKFDRRKQMPQSVSVDITDTDTVVKADTTTVAVLAGKTPKLYDSPGMWFLTGACGQRIAASGESNKDPLHLRERTGDGDLTKADAFTAGDLALAGTATATHSVIFVPGSCRPVLYTTETRTFQTLDPASRAIGPDPIVTLPKGGGSIRMYNEPETWQPAPDTEVFAVAVQGQIVIVDLHAGTAKTVPSDGLDTARVVAWLP